MLLLGLLSLETELTRVIVIVALHHCSPITALNDLIKEQVQ